MTDVMTVLEHLAAQPHEEKLVRNRLVERGYSIPEATRRARHALSRSPAPGVNAAASDAAIRAAVDRGVREALAASRALQPPPGSAQALPERQPAAVPARPLHEMSWEEFGRVDIAESLGAGCASPFWSDVRETAPAAGVSETTAATELLELNGEQLARMHVEASAVAGQLASPFWAG